MSVRRNHRGKWTVDICFTHSDGRQQRITRTSPLQSKRGAQQYERQVRQALLDGTHDRKEVPTFNTFVEKQWLPIYPAAAGNRPRTVREKKDHCRLYLQPALGKIRLDRIKGRVVDRLFAGLRKNGLAPKTIKNIRATLRRILASAVEWELIAAVPRLPKVKVPDPEWDFFNREEADTLVQAARDLEERALLMFALHTGARAGEQLALEWGDLDWQSRLVVFRRAQVGNTGKTGPTKSGKERRVPLTTSLQDALKAIRHLRGPLVFCRVDGSPLTIWQLHEHVWGACRRAGLRKVRWHDQRHSFASNLVAASVPIRQVQEWLGHASITTTMRYAHLAPGGGSEYIAALDSPVSREHGANTGRAVERSSTNPAG